MTDSCARATLMAYQTKDLFLVQELLGHKNALNTQKYINLAKKLQASEEDNHFVVSSARTVDEAVKLGEVGFQYFTTIDGIQLFRKRKWPTSL